MSHFIVEFHRRRLEAAEVEQYDDADEAQSRLCLAEMELRSYPGRGVVTLHGESKESLRQTHASYFLNLDELLDTALG